MLHTLHVGCWAMGRLLLIVVLICLVFQLLNPPLVLISQEMCLARRTELASPLFLRFLRVPIIGTTITTTLPYPSHTLLLAFLTALLTSLEAAQLSGPPAARLVPPRAPPSLHAVVTPHLRITPIGPLPKTTCIMSTRSFVQRSSRGKHAQETTW